MDAAAKREAAAAIEAYVDFLHYDTKTISHSPEWLKDKIKDIKAQMKLPDVTWVQKAKLLQRLKDYEAELEGGSESDRLKQGFIENAVAWSTESGIDAAVWRDLKVPASVLKEAGF